MKRYVKQSETASPLKQEAERVFDKVSTYPGVIDMIYVSDTDSYCIRFDNNTDDVTWIYDVMDELHYTSDGNDDSATYWHKGKDYRAWFYEDPDLELYISR